MHYENSFIILRLFQTNHLWLLLRQSKSFRSAAQEGFSARSRVPAHTIPDSLGLERLLTRFRQGLW
jgi:hypothetical protein